MSAVEAYLQSRYHMYRNVYFHKVVRSAEGMVKLALQRAKRLAVQDRLHVAAAGSSGVQGAARAATDVSKNSPIWMMFRCCTVSSSGSTADDAVLAGLCRGLLYRRLFKTIDLSHLCESDALAAVVRAAGGHRRRGR